MQRVVVIGVDPMMTGKYPDLPQVPLHMFAVALKALPYWLREKTLAPRA
jgi:hypothetical protein